MLNSTSIILISLCLALSRPANAENADTTLRKIKAAENLILDASKRMNVSATCLKAIIYTERTLNYDWEDDLFDDIIARAGLNSSLGFCQLKLKTAYWIERQLNDPESRFYPGDKYKGRLKPSASPGELIRKLEADSINILYAAAYIRIIESRWQKAGFQISNRPDILGTLYFAGLFKRTGEERKPNNNPGASSYGIKVREALKLFR